MSLNEVIELTKRYIDNSEDFDIIPNNVAGFNLELYFKDQFKYEIIDRMPTHPVFEKYLERYGRMYSFENFFTWFFSPLSPAKFTVTPNIEKRCYEVKFPKQNNKVLTQAVYKLADTLSINSIHQQMKEFNEKCLIDALEKIGNNEHLIESIKEKGLPKLVICSEDKYEFCALVFNFCKINVHKALPAETVLLSWVDGPVEFPRFKLHENFPPYGLVVVPGQTT